MNYLDLFDQPVSNEAGAQIPGAAVLQVSGMVTAHGKMFYRVKQPDGNGVMFLINQPFPIEAGKTGVAALVTRNPGVHALFQGELQVGREIGPKINTWTMTPEGKGFVNLGDTIGAPAAPPGFPPTSSSTRVRVGPAPGGGESAPLIRYELITDKRLDYADATAMMLDANNQPLKDNSGNPVKIVVVDRPDRTYQGFAKWKDPKWGDVNGARGYCQLFTQTYLPVSQGAPPGAQPGYAIIDMEGPARWVEGRCILKYKAPPLSQQGGFDGPEPVFKMLPLRYWGNHPNGMPPKTTKKTFSSAETGGQAEELIYIEVLDSLNALLTLEKGVDVRALFNDASGRYVLDDRVKQEGALTLVSFERGIVAAKLETVGDEFKVIPGVTEDCCRVLRWAVPPSHLEEQDVSAERDYGVNLNLVTGFDGTDRIICLARECEVEVDDPSGPTGSKKRVKAYIAPFSDMRAIPGYVPGRTLMPGFPPQEMTGPDQAAPGGELNTIEKWISRLVGYQGGEIMSIGKNANGGPEWQIDVMCGQAIPGGGGTGGTG